MRYAAALGDRGIAAYRKAVAAADGDSFAVRYSHQRLAILDQDIEAIVRISVAISRGRTSSSVSPRR